MNDSFKGVGLGKIPNPLSGSILCILLSSLHPYFSDSLLFFANLDKGSKHQILSPLPRKDLEELNMYFDS